MAVRWDCGIAASGHAGSDGALHLSKYRLPYCAIISLGTIRQLSNLAGTVQMLTGPSSLGEGSQLCHQRDGPLELSA